MLDRKGVKMTSPYNTGDIIADLERLKEYGSTLYDAADQSGSTMERMLALEITTLINICIRGFSGEKATTMDNGSSFDESISS